MLFHSLGVILKGVLLSYGCPLAQLTFPSPPSGAWMGKLLLCAGILRLLERGRVRCL